MAWFLSFKSNVYIIWWMGISSFCKLLSRWVFYWGKRWFMWYLCDVILLYYYLNLKHKEMKQGRFAPWVVSPRFPSDSVPSRISKGQGAGPEKWHFSALLDFQKKACFTFRVTVKSNKVFNQVLTFIFLLFIHEQIGQFIQQINLDRILSFCP